MLNDSPKINFFKITQLMNNSRDNIKEIRKTVSKSLEI